MIEPCMCGDPYCPHCGYPEEDAKQCNLPSLDKLEFKVPKGAYDMLKKLNWPKDVQATLRLLETVQWFGRLGKSYCGLTFTHALAADVLALIEINGGSCKLLYTAPKWNNDKVHHSDWWPHLTFTPHDLAGMLADSKPDSVVLFGEQRVPECMLFLADVEWSNDGTIEHKISAMYTHMIPKSGIKNFIPLRKQRNFGAEWPESIIWEEEKTSSLTPTSE